MRQREIKKYERNERDREPDREQEKESDELKRMIMCERDTDKEREKEILNARAKRGTRETSFHRSIFANRLSLSIHYY